MSENEFSITPPLGGYKVRVTRDVRVPTDNTTVTLSADVYLPEVTDPVPALVTLLPYRKDVHGVALEPSLRWFAERGYASVLVDLRGTGSSDGPLRPPLDPGDADDAVAVIEWAAEQPWCDGSVGMWGHSYGAVTTMRAASRNPTQLKAILPYQGPLDPERALWHPHGAWGDWTRLEWGMSTLAAHLLPPMHNHHSPEEQRRWRDRLHNGEPYIVELFRHGPGDPMWRQQVVDTEAITVPALCVGGWQDVFCDEIVRAFEEIAGPKKLLMGPWGHILPHHSPVEDIDFLAIALEWWDYWLRDVENGVMSGPPVTLYVQGERPGWLSLESWSNLSTEWTLATGTDTVLRESAVEETPASDAIAVYESDPTLGVLSGMWGTGASGLLPRPDQHNDDARSLSFTSDPLSDDVFVVGRPEVTLWLASDGAAPIRPVERLVVRLTAVDQRGRSTFITGGVLCPNSSASSHRIELWSTAYRVPAGHRLRVVLSDADFPRLRPLADASCLPVLRLELSAPLVPHGLGAAVEMRRVEGVAPESAVGPLADARWEITRDPVREGIEVVVGASTVSPTLDGEHQLHTHTETRATVRQDAPAAAVVQATQSRVAKLKTGETFEVKATARAGQIGLWVHGEVSIDGMTIFSRTWEAAAPAEEETAIDSSTPPS